MLKSIFGRSVIVLSIMGVLIFFYRSYTTPECKSRISYDEVYVNKGIDLDSLFHPAFTGETQEILAEWQETSYQSDSFHLISKNPYSHSRPLTLVEHYAEGRKHYGAVIFPADYQPSRTYPVLVWASGLNQSSPQVNVQHRTMKRMVEKLRKYFVVIPSFRGQALVYDDTHYCSDGFFGDAFDGATEDALRLLYLVKEEFEGVDFKRINACGISRGGTVALLMGIRDTTLNKIVSVAGPTNFFSQKAFHRYGFQYKYQFLSKTNSLPLIRNKILKSSPQHFISHYPHELNLIHGKQDKTVSVDHAYGIIGQLKERESFTYSLTDGGHAFYDWDPVIAWIKKNELEI